MIEKNETVFTIYEDNWDKSDRETAEVMAGNVESEDLSFSPFGNITSIKLDSKNKMLVLVGNNHFVEIDIENSQKHTYRIRKIKDISLE